VPDGVGGVDKATPQPVVVVASHGVDDLTSNCLGEGQQTSGMSVNHAENLVDGCREASTSLSVVIVKLRKYLQQRTLTMLQRSGIL